MRLADRLRQQGFKPSGVNRPIGFSGSTVHKSVSFSGSIYDRLSNLDPADLEDLCCEHPDVAEWLEDLEAGHDVEDMLEDYGVDEDELLDYIDENGM